MLIVRLRTPKHPKELELSDTTLFFQAIQAGEASKVKALLDSNPSLATVKNERGQSGVLLAAYSGRKEIRDLLLARDVTLELHEAAAAGQLERVQHLVEKDPALAKRQPRVSLSASSISWRRIRPWQRVTRRMVFLSSLWPLFLGIAMRPSICLPKARM